MIGLAVYVFVAGISGAPLVPASFLIKPQISLELVRNLKFVFADGFLDLTSYWFVAFFIAALTAFGSWDRTRYFGNTAPLLTAFVVVEVFALVPSIYIWEATLGLSFVFVFIGGVFADLLETNVKRLVSMILAAGFLLRIILGLWALSRWARIPV